MNPYKLGFITMAMAVVLTFLLLHQFVVSESNIEVREAAKKKNVFFWKSNVGGKLPFLTQISPFVFPNLTKTLGWVGG